MEQPQDPSANVDTSRPFRSVKEAVAIFGEQRLFVGKFVSSPSYQQPPQKSININTFSPRREPEITSAITIITGDEQEEGGEEDQEVLGSSSSGYLSNNNDNNSGGGNGLSDELKKLEAELAETKKELKLLKQRESETEVAVAALNAELHRSMSRLAMAEASAAAKAAALSSARSASPADFGRGRRSDQPLELEDDKKKASDREIVRQEIKYYPTLAEILSIGERRKTAMMMKKQKPIVPLVGDMLFSWKRRASSPLHNHPLYSSPRLFN